MRDRRVFVRKKRRTRVWRAANALSEDDWGTQPSSQRMRMQPLHGIIGAVNLNLNPTNLQACQPSMGPRLQSVIPAAVARLGAGRRRLPPMLTTTHAHNTYTYIYIYITVHNQDFDSKQHR